MASNNPYRNTRIEFHILQSFPVSCLNRDDVGSPKSAVIGGTPRARVSSQCWKRAIRMEMRNYGIQLADRTKLIDKLIKPACMERGATEEQAQKCSALVCETFLKSKKQDSKKTEDSSDVSEKSKKGDVLFFISHKEVAALADFFQEKEFDVSEYEVKKEEKKKKDGKKENGSKAKMRLVKVLLTENGIDPNRVQDGVDIALFGRMVADAAKLNVEAAASFAHAISTHKVVSEVEFFTAVDDLNPEDETGAGHMGSLEFNSATYYRYISIDLGKLYENLNGPEDMTPAIEAFVHALYDAIPIARQSTMAAATPWDYAKILVRKGQRLQASFEKAVSRKRDSSILEESKSALNKELGRFEKLSGSHFGKIREYTFGENLDFSIDQLAEALKTDVAALGKE